MPGLKISLWLGGLLATSGVDLLTPLFASQMVELPLWVVVLLALMPAEDIVDLVRAVSRRFETPHESAQDS